MNAIEISQLEYSVRDYWTYRKKQLLSPFDLNIKAGEAFGFLGHNGAGKTTTIKCLLGFLTITGGNVSIFGHDIGDPQSRALIGYLSEQPYFYDYLTVRETLSLFASLSKISGSECRKKVEAAAERVGITERLDHRMRTLSKGLTQRVGLAQAIVHSPRLLILDEPFSGLDPIGRREFRDIFSALKRDGVTLFMSSHVLPDVEFLCDRVSILSRGNLKGVFDLNNLPSSANATFELTLAGERAAIKAKFANEVLRCDEDREGVRLIFSSEQGAANALKTGLDSSFKLVSYSRERGNLEQLFETLVTFKEGSK